MPAPYRERAQYAYRTGQRAVGLVHEDLRPSAILTRPAFLNAIRASERRRRRSLGDASLSR